MLHVTIDGLEVAGSPTPLLMLASKPDVERFRVEGSGLLGAVAGHAAEVRIQCHDKFGNSCVQAGTGARFGLNVLPASTGRENKGEEGEEVVKSSKKSKEGSKGVSAAAIARAQQVRLRTLPIRCLEAGRGRRTRDALCSCCTLHAAPSLPCPATLSFVLFIPSPSVSRPVLPPCALPRSSPLRRSRSRCLTPASGRGIASKSATRLSRLATLSSICGMWRRMHHTPHASHAAASHAACITHPSTAATRGACTLAHSLVAALAVLIAARHCVR